MNDVQEVFNEFYDQPVDAHVNRSKPRLQILFVIHNNIIFVTCILNIFFIYFVICSFESRHLLDCKSRFLHFPWNSCSCTCYDNNAREVLVSSYIYKVCLRHCIIKIMRIIRARVKWIQHIFCLTFRCISFYIILRGMVLFLKLVCHWRCYDLVCVRYLCRRTIIRLWTRDLMRH